MSARLRTVRGATTKYWAKKVSLKKPGQVMQTYRCRRCVINVVFTWKNTYTVCTHTQNRSHHSALHTSSFNRPPFRCTRPNSPRHSSTPNVRPARTTAPSPQPTPYVPPPSRNPPATLSPFEPTLSTLAPTPPTPNDALIMACLAKMTCMSFLV